MERIRIKDLPYKDCSYEKYLCLGPNSLSGIKLLAVILRTGSRKGNSLNLADSLPVLGNPGDDLPGLLHHSLGDFVGIKGAGRVKGVQLFCMKELSKRIWKRKASEHALYFGHPEGIPDYYIEDMRYLEQKEIRVMFLNTKQAIVRDQTMTRGTVNASVMTSREVLIERLRCRVVSMVLAHNHPSGGPTLSRVGMLPTKHLKETGELVGITLIDHAVIGDRRHFSLRGENLM